MPESNLYTISLSVLPIALLLFTIMVFKWSAPRAGAVVWIIAIIIAYLFFGADIKLLSIASSKGLSLSIFVLTIIWTSVFLYNVVDSVGGIKIVGEKMSGFVDDPVAQALIVGWSFSGLIQGIAGFGVPVAVVTPLLVLLKFSPAKSAAIVLIGHSWAVALGSMGSAFYTIELVTAIDGDVLGPHMALLLVLPIILTGLAVACLVEGISGIWRSLHLVLIAGAAMSVTVWIMTAIGAPQIASLVPGLIGCLTIWVVVKSRIFNVGRKDFISESDEDTNLKTVGFDRFNIIFLPYYVLFLLTILSQVPIIKEMTSGLAFGFNYPSTITHFGYVTEATEGYAAIKILGHPAPIIAISILVAYFVYRVAKIWPFGLGVTSMRRTINDCVPTSVGAVMMIMMATVMTDTGMTALFGSSIAIGTGHLFPLFSPFIGVLGTFITGSNTSSNILFGGLQVETAKLLGVNYLTVASTQSIGGSLGSAIAPAKVLVGTAIVGLSGREREVLRLTLPYCLIIVIIVGFQAWILTRLF